MKSVFCPLTSLRLQRGLVLFFGIMAHLATAASPDSLVLQTLRRAVHRLTPPQPHPASQTHVAWLTCSYGRADISNTDAIFQILRLRIDSVELCYTDFPQGHNLETLHRARLERLFFLYPGLFEQQQVRWIITGQQAQNRQQADSLFHGFRFYYATKKAMRRQPDGSYREVDVPDEQRFKGFKGDLVEARIGTDTAVLQTLSRLSLQGQKVVFVCDFTASMYPYTLQLLRWQIRQNTSRQILGYTFFNDGDDKKTGEKKIGQTGGVYHLPNANLDSVLRCMEQVRQRGDGGDLPENVLEALLSSMQHFDQAQTFILIADNQAAIRDKILVRQLPKPFQIILGRVDSTFYPIGLQYVRLALLTGSSLHTPTQDFRQAEDLNRLGRQLWNNLRQRRKKRPTTAH